MNVIEILSYQHRMKCMLKKLRFYGCNVGVCITSEHFFRSTYPGCRIFKFTNSVFVAMPIHLTKNKRHQKILDIRNTYKKYVNKLVQETITGDYQYSKGHRGIYANEISRILHDPYTCIEDMIK